MPHIILKRTLKVKDRKNEKSLSFHGPSISTALVGMVNEAVAMGIKYSSQSRLLTFAINREGHFCASMDHNFQKIHEEDAIAIILDVMEENGWTMKHQYDSFSEMGFTSSETSKDIIIFYKPRSRE